MDILNNTIKEQNLILLKNIADKKYEKEEDRENFINKYNKLNYRLLLVVKQDIHSIYEKKIEKIVR